MDYTEFPINQSLIRKLLLNGEEKDTCMRNIYVTKITKTCESETTTPMQYGKYFESQCLGKSAKGDIVNDLPRKKLTKSQIQENAQRKHEKRPLLQGEMYLDHIRTNDQIMRFKALVDLHRMIITDANVQVPLFTRWKKDHNVMLKAELDIFPTTILLEGELEAAIIDLKLTADIHNTYGEYCYGKPEYLDLIQAKMYHYIVRNLDSDLNRNIDNIVTDSVKNLIKQNRIKFLLWIFNYKGKTLEDKFIQVQWDNLKEAELHESIRKTISILDKGEAEDWPTNPLYELCKRCPWTDCPDKIKMQTI